MGSAALGDFIAADQGLARRSQYAPQLHHSHSIMYSTLLSTWTRQHCLQILLIALHHA
jgi:hypothetical protein